MSCSPAPERSTSDFVRQFISPWMREKSIKSHKAVANTSTEATLEARTPRSECDASRAVRMKMKGRLMGVLSNAIISIAFMGDTLVGLAPREAALWILSERPGGGDYISDAVVLGEGTWTAWTWAVSTSAAYPDEVIAFQNRYDCRSGLFTRLRQEHYVAGELVEVSAEPSPPRPPHMLEVEARVMQELCTGRSAPRQMRPNLADARRRAASF